MATSAIALGVLAIVSSIAGGDAFQALRYKTISGPSIRRITTNKPGVCYNACVAEPTCNVAIFFGGPSRCWLKAQPISALEDTEAGFLYALIPDDVEAAGFQETNFVQMPRATDGKSFPIRGEYAGIMQTNLDCEMACYEKFGKLCAYTQLDIASKRCTIAKSCVGMYGKACQDVRTYWTVGVRNFSRVYCKNEIYRAAWATWTGSYPKGDNPCSNVIL